MSNKERRNAGQVILGWSWWVKLRGNWRLHFGFCPLCNSSPPLKACYVCRGEENVGPLLSPSEEDIWRGRFKEFMEIADG